MTDYNNCKFKKDRIALLREKLGTNEAWAIRGLTVIFDYQTADEQNMEATVEHNGVGFTGADGEILSSFAKQIRKGRKMSPKQMALIFKKMPKYAKQLDGVAQRKAEKEAAAVTEKKVAVRDPNEEDPNRGNKTTSRSISRSQAIQHGVVTYTGD